MRRVVIGFVVFFSLVGCDSRAPREKTIRYDSLAKKIGCIDKVGADSVKAGDISYVEKLIHRLSFAKSEFETVSEYNKKLNVASDSICGSLVLIGANVNKTYNPDIEAFVFAPEVKRVSGIKQALKIASDSQRTIKNDSVWGALNVDSVSNYWIASDKSDKWEFEKVVIKSSKLEASKIFGEIQYIVVLRASPEFDTNYVQTSGDRIDMIGNAYTTILSASEIYPLTKSRITIKEKFLGAKPEGWIIRNSRTLEVYAKGKMINKTN